MRACALVPVVVLAASVCLGTVCLQSSASPSPTLNCSGRKVLNGDEGYISDGPKHYLANSHCEWLIEAGSPNKTIHLQFRTMSTECSFDFLFIYDGKSYSSPLLATLSGDSMPHPVTARSGYMLLYLYSDRNYLKDGFEAYYFIYDCPWNCSNRGVCTNHTCRCHAGYYGDGCQHQVCVDNCNGHGTCVPVSRTMQRCECHEGYAGHSCDVSLSDGGGQARWYTLQPSGGGFKGRTSHTAVFLDHTDCLWVFGGFDLNSVLDDLSRYCFRANRWESMAISSPWPQPRSGHAMAAHSDGFYIFGGVLANGSHSNELWFYNTTSETWVLTAGNSSVVPHAVTGHTLTAVDAWLYLIGGKTEDRVSRDNVYRIDATKAESWEVVVVKGSRYPPKRLVGHSTIYHKESHTLIVFGGYIQSSALFSDRTRQIHSLSLHDNYWSELINNNWRDLTIPKERAFHSAVTIGNYMVVYGGNTHDHAGLEICYNSRMYFYHLGCHVWLNHTYFTGPLTAKGRFGHVATVARGNLMLITGGYSGQVLDDLIVYKVPAAISPHQQAQNDSDHCQNYRILMLCLDDPECVFCSRGSELGMSSCVHRSRSELCLEGDVQDTPDRCPGVCPALHTCGACVSHGRGANLTNLSPQRRVHVNECSWCVKEAKCQTRSVPAGTCRAADQTSSGIQGWWGGLSENLTTLLQCQQDDFPAGLHWIKYRNPMNLSFPDELTIKRTTSGTLGYVSTHKIESEFTYTARFVGFLHPLNAPPPDGETLRLYLGLSHAQARLYLSADETEERKEKVISMGKQSVFNMTFADRKQGRPLFANVSRGHKYYMAQVTEQVQRQTYPKDTDAHSSEVTIGWNGCLSLLSNLRQHVITSEFLEPYSKGLCSHHYNCLGCLTDTLCSWCQVTRSCILRNDTNLTCMAARDEEGFDETQAPEEQYYITSASECPSCGNHVQCHTCADDPLCEWVAKNGHCTRRYRIEDAIRVVSECRPPCHHRRDCAECIAETGQCVWCENTQTCLPFSDYVTRYIYGQCTSWVDTITMGHGCHNCSVHSQCDSCLSSFSCGWCGNDDNPTLGVCVDGDFTGPRAELTCSAIVGDKFNISTNQSASWSYDRCPDVEECRLGLHDCHLNATCQNTFDGYECHCNQGFVGDGREHCEKTCFYNCVHGHCSGPLDYVCICHLGWTNPWCNESCLCNNHSTCSKGVGLCDECQHRTTGQNCELCSSGSYGNPQDLEGCRPCDCNGHGDQAKGECHGVTGECFCTHNTHGLHCDLCQEGYYGNPRNGGKCYLQCDDRSVYPEITEGGVGSYRGKGVKDPSHAYCLWILTIFDTNTWGTQAFTVTRIISFTVEGDMQVECGQDAIQVYDGIPAHINGTADSSARHLGSICGLNPGREFTVHAYSGTITIIFEANLLTSQTRGFNATYKTEVCQGDCADDADWNWKCIGGKCVCETGFYGPDCQQEMCPNDCSADKGQGSCDVVHGMCRCQASFAGADCSIDIGANPHVELLVDKSRLGKEVPAPTGRVGHTMVSCGDHKLYVFGGYNLEQGLLSDMWRYDTLSGEWELLEPRVHRPRGRYQHAAACVPGRLQIFIYGGFLDSDRPEILMGDRKKQTPQPTNELWIFNIGNRLWEKPTTPPWMPALVGHSLTYVGDNKLVLIGGFSSQIYFSNKVYEYDADSVLLNWQEFSPQKMNGAYPIGLYGHSAVYNQPSNTIYVYGGYLFRAGRWFVSRELYTYDVALRQWNLLMIQGPDFPPPDLKSDKEPLPWEGRVFHTAVGTDTEMITIGGLMDDGSYAMDLLVYRYHCNTWHRIQFAQFEVEQKTITVMGVRAVLDGGHIYMFGGFVGNMVGTLSRLTLPEDICAIFSHDECLSTMGCHICGNATAGVCFTAGKRRRRPLECTMQDSSESRKQCSAHWYNSQNCSRFKSCSQCLSKYPQFKAMDQRCQWCTNCPKGACIPVKASCPKDQNCPMDQHIIQQLGSCFEYLCPASDCQMCSHLAKCLWTRHFKRSSEIGRFYNKDPVYNWNCVTRTLRPLSASTFVGYPPGECPQRCYQHRNCSQCLLSQGVEGGSQMCMWSEMLRECLPPAYLPLRCSLGECGYIHSGRQADTCPVECHMKKQCAHCITTPGCGWCALGQMNGQGLCMRGGLVGPTGGSCREGNIRSDTGHQLDQFGTNPVWAFSKCPPENECANGHHTCDEETQDCHDTLTSFRCECKQGYIKTANGRCEPVCHQGCIYGMCVQPDVCQCFFGWVGDNCSVECQCHKHSNCVSVAKRDECIQCENNTMGRQCEMCRPFFVGDPKTGDPCIPCRQFCNNHTDVCVSRDENEVRMMGSQKHTLKLQSRGPSKMDAMCLNCLHNTTGDKCGECTDGHFRKQGEPKTWGCMACQCNGHSNKCSRETGENCACQNNTETDCEPKDGLQCWQLQCSQCKEYFLGTPTNGHQCYRQMQVDLEYCLDPNSQTDCLHDPVALLPGRTVFYAVQPKYLNVDIRITIDVTQGGADVFFSNREDMFQVFVNSMNGIHSVNVDPQYKVDINSLPPVEASARQRRSTGDISAFGEYGFEHVTASSLNTYITISEKNTILVVRNVQFRLVITLPEKDHNLRVSRFYIIVQSRESPASQQQGSTDPQLRDKTYGILYFRQDQPHIDLFVFFSVFFSCFFLFLALCVMLWKVKQAFDARRSRQLREREMECMASRPFAKVLVLVEPNDAGGSGGDDDFGVGLDGFGFGFGGTGNNFMSTIYHRRGRLSRPMLRLHHPMELSPSHAPPPRTPQLSVVPVAVEPTDDGVAAVGTVLFELPGAWQAPCHLCMGSTLTMRITPPQVAHKPTQRRRASSSPC